MYENRVKRLLLILVKHEGEQCSASHLSFELQVSKNTIRNDIALLRRELSPYDAQIISKRGVGNGYTLHVNHQKKFDQFLEKMNDDKKYQKYSPENRVLLIVILLIKNDEFVKSESIADWLYLSTKQISKDLLKVKLLLSDYQLSLLSRPHYGIKVEGTEYRKRLCLNRIFENNEGLLKDFLTNNISDLDVLLTSTFMEWNLSITGAAIHTLAIYFLIMLQRIQEGKFLPNKAKVFEVQNSLPEFRIASKFQTKIKTFYEIEIPSSEVGYMAVLIAAHQIIDYSHIENLTSVYQYLISEINQRMKTYFGLDMSNNPELQAALKKYLNPMIVRVDFDLYQNKTNEYDKYRQKILLGYAMGIEVADVINQILGYHLVEFDILNIAMIFQEHINKINHRKKDVLVITASDGEGIIGLARSLFLQYFGSFIEKFEFKPSYKLNHLDVSNYDIYINLDQGEDNIITLFTDEGYIQIRNRLCNCYLSEEHFEMICNEKQVNRCKVETFDNLILKMEEMISLNIGKYRFVEKMTQKASIASLAFSSGIIFITLCEPIEQTSFFLLMNETHILYDDLYIRGIMVLMQSKKRLYEDYPLYVNLGKIIDSSNKIEKLAQISTYDNLKKLMGVHGK